MNARELLALAPDAFVAEWRRASMTSSTVPPLAIIHRQTRRGDDGVGTAAATDAHYTATDAENATDAATATTAKYATTDAFLQPLVDAMNADAIDGADSPLVELDTHEAVVVAVGEHTGTLMTAFLHNTRRGPATGGVRRMSYPTVGALFHDGLRISRAMTLKCALAGIWCGGGKGLVAENSGNGDRHALFAEYGQMVARLNGAFIATGDVGATTEDVLVMYQHTRFITGLPRAMGGSGNPGAVTALGIAVGLEAAFHFHGRSSGITGARIAIQGLGHVGEALVDYLLDRGAAHIYASKRSDVGVSVLLARIARTHGPDKLSILVTDDPRAVLALDVDAVCPCATGGALNPETIPLVRAPIVCGAANNQLMDAERDGEALHYAGKLYVPDFLVNRMGIVACAEEPQGYVHPPSADPLIAKHLSRDWHNSVYQCVLRVLKESRRTDRPTHVVALEQAMVAAQELHPIYGHRGVAILHGVAEAYRRLE